MRFRAAVVTAVIGLTTLGVPSGFVASAAAAEPIDTTAAVVATADPGTHVTRTVTLPWSANLVGASFVGADADAAGVSIVVQPRQQGGWGEAVALRVDDHEGADGAEASAASARTFTVPQWIGRARALRVTVALDDDAAPVADVRLVAINADGEPTEVHPVARAMRALGSWLTSTPVSRTAQAYPNKPAIISRRQWRANEDLRNEGSLTYAPTVKMAFVHHTANSNGYTKSQSDDLVRGIYRYHTKSLGWSDIGYNFLVDRFGQVFEGRYGGITKAVVGAHARGFNTGSTGVALIGNFTSAAPPKAALSALKKILSWKLDQHHVPPVGKVTMVSAGNDKYPRGTTVSFHRISGHRDGNSTSCPGYETYRRLGAIRDSVNGMGRPKIYLPATSGTTLRPDGDGASDTFRVTATLSQTARWSVSFTDSAGTLRRRLTGRSSSVSAVWNGLLATGARAPTGRYTWRLDARDGDGHPATPAGGVVYVVNSHPNGTLLKDSSGSYFLYAGKRRALTAVTQAAKFPGVTPVTTGPAERTWYADGGAYPLRNGALLEGPGGRYIWSDGQLRRFADNPADLYAALGYDPDAAIPAPQEFIDSLPAGPPVNDTSRHPSGTVVRDGATQALFLIEGDTRRPLSALVFRSRYAANEVVTAIPDDLSLPEGDAYPIRPGALIAATDGGRPYVVIGGKKRRFITWTLFSRMGFTKAMLLPASEADAAAIPAGPTYG